MNSGVYSIWLSIVSIILAISIFISIFFHRPKTVYKGVLSYISDPNIPQYARTEKPFIKIGDNRIDNVYLSNYQYNALNHFMGKEIALSGLRSGVRRKGVFRVYAIRRPDGKVFKSSIIDKLVIYVILGWIIVTMSFTILAMGWELKQFSNILIFGIISIYSTYFFINRIVTLLRVSYAL